MNIPLHRRSLNKRELVQTLDATIRHLWELQNVIRGWDKKERKVLHEARLMLERHKRKTGYDEDAEG